MITAETELNLYKVKKLEDGAEIYIVAKDFQQLAEDLKATEIEPLEITFEKEIFLSTWLINKYGHK